MSGFGWSIDVPARCASSVKVSEVAANPVYDQAAADALRGNPMLLLKPDFTNMPAHIAFDLSGCFPGDKYWTQLRVLPRKEFESILDVPGQQQRMLADDFVRLAQWIASGRELIQWPFLPFLDISQGSTASVQRIEFSGGRGMRLLAMFTVDNFIARRDSFDYVFQGLSERGGCFVLMTASVSIAGLAEPDVTEDRGHTLDVLSKDSGARRRYDELVRTQLQAPDTKVTPALSELDAVVLSLQGECSADAAQRSEKPRH